MKGAAPDSSCPLSSSDHKQTAHHPGSLLPRSVWTSDCAIQAQALEIVMHGCCKVLGSAYSNTIHPRQPIQKMQPTHNTMLHTNLFITRIDTTRSDT